MVEASFQDLVFRTTLLAFDGRVLERFVPHLASNYRMHVTHLAVRVHQPDRRGHWRVEFKFADGSNGGYDAQLDDAGYTAAHPVLAALAEAGVPFLS